MAEEFFSFFSSLLRRLIDEPKENKDILVNLSQCYWSQHTENMENFQSDYSTNATSNFKIIQYRRQRGLYNPMEPLNTERDPSQWADSVRRVRLRMIIFSVLSMKISLTHSAHMIRKSTSIICKGKMVT